MFHFQRHHHAADTTASNKVVFLYEKSLSASLYTPTLSHFPPADSTAAEVLMQEFLLFFFFFDKSRSQIRSLGLFLGNSVWLT